MVKQYMYTDNTQFQLVHALPRYAMLRLLWAFITYSAATKFVLQVGVESKLHTIMGDRPGIQTGVEFHVAEFVPPTPAKSKPKKRCRVCYRNGVRKDTRVHCVTCNTHPGLCYPVCYTRYHTRLYHHQTRY